MVPHTQAGRRNRPWAKLAVTGTFAEGVKLFRRISLREFFTCFVTLF